MFSAAGCVVWLGGAGVPARRGGGAGGPMCVLASVAATSYMASPPARLPACMYVCTWCKATSHLLWPACLPASAAISHSSTATEGVREAGAGGRVYQSSHPAQPSHYQLIGQPDSQPARPAALHTSPLCSKDTCCVHPCFIHLQQGPGAHTL